MTLALCFMLIACSPGQTFHPLSHHTGFCIYRYRFSFSLHVTSDIKFLLLFGKYCEEKHEKKEIVGEDRRDPLGRVPFERARRPPEECGVSP